MLTQLEGQRAHLRPPVVVALSTGMRLGDQLNLRWSQVDFQYNLVHVPNAKTGQEYEVPMNQDVRRELQTLKRVSADAEYVFVSAGTGAGVRVSQTSAGTICGTRSARAWARPATVPMRSRS